MGAVSHCAMLFLPCLIECVLQDLVCVSPFSPALRVVLNRKAIVLVLCLFFGALS
jgi:hypothetical protein